jgi:ABC-type branched-subunit amino acid transport system ATPase component/predicted MFS family arabinose efflux permease
VIAGDGGLERIEVTQADRDHARSLLGLGDAHPEHSDHRPLRQVLKSTNVGWYVVLALGLLGLADTLQGYAFGVMAPEIARTLGITRSELAGLNAFKTLATAALTIPLVMTVQRNPRRALVSVVAAFVWAVFAMMTAFVTTLGGLAVVLVMDGATSGARGTMHVPLLADSYPPQARVRVLSWYSGLGAAGNVIAPLAVAVLGTWAGLTWRGVFVFTGAFTLVAAVCALWLRDPGFGHWDTQKLREEQVVSANEREDDADAPHLGFTEITQRLLLVPSIRRQLAGFMVLGVMAIPLSTFVTFLLDERWGIGPGGRGVIASLQAAVALVTLALFGRIGERMLRRDPAAVVRLASKFIVVSTLATSIAAISPVFVVVIVLLVIGSAGLAMLSPALAALQMGLVPAEMRPHAIALGGLAMGFGGLTGSLYLAGIDRRFGVAGAIVALAIPGLIAAAIVRSCGRTLEPDIDRMVTDVIEEARVRSARANGATLPLLAVRGIDAKYGDLQVLFDIDLTVDEGEVVALLGTNGSGKSTLLKVVSGLLLPSSGSVRLSGADITFVSAERRVGMGVTQIPGGHAVFGPLTVVENLLAYADTLDLGSRSAPEIDRCFEIFPALADRRHQLASTLSGGEQQMLALAKAAILRPRLLLIDELSLGLAPTVVGELLDRVGDLREAGSTIVLVEQSVNLALSVCERAYFLERGEVRFSGRGEDLLARDDLLRAVFLGEHE